MDAHTAPLNALHRPDVFLLCHVCTDIPAKQKLCSSGSPTFSEAIGLDTSFQSMPQHAQERSNLRCIHVALLGSHLYGLLSMQCLTVAGWPCRSILGRGDALGEVAFFTEIAQLETVRTVSVCRILVVPRIAYNSIAAAFPIGARAILTNLLSRAQEVRSQPFRPC